MKFVRSILFSLLVFPFLTVFFCVLGLIWFVLTGRRDFLGWCAYSWGRCCLWSLGIKLQISGRENIPQKGCMFLFNHTSFVDIFALTASIPHVRFGAKIELFSIPFFGQAMRAAGILPITRKDRRNAIRVLTKAQERARLGEKFALAPEGGRNSVEKLLPFKSGPFIFAIQSGVPLVPVIIHGACEAWPKGSLFPCLGKWRHEVREQFLAPIPVDGWKIEQKTQLRDSVRNLMLPYFDP